MAFEIISISFFVNEQESEGFVKNLLGASLARLLDLICATYKDILEEFFAANLIVSLSYADRVVAKKDDVVFEDAI